MLDWTTFKLFWRFYLFVISLVKRKLWLEKYTGLISCNVFILEKKKHTFRDDEEDGGDGQKNLVNLSFLCKLCTADLEIIWI